MEIQATAYLRYWDGQAISTSPERLVLVIKFKEKGQLFKTVIKKCLVSTANFYVSYESYLDELEKVVGDREYIVSVVEYAVKDYFKEKQSELTDAQRLDKILETKGNIGEIKVTVKID